jgi:transposase
VHVGGLTPLRIGTEGCGRGHDWARCVRGHGPDVRVIAPPLVNPCVKLPKHAARAADAIVAAVTRHTMRFVPIQRGAPQDLIALHRVRARLLTARTALVNEIRGLLNEYGIVLPQSLAKFRALIVDRLEADQAKLTALSTEVS